MPTARSEAAWVGKGGPRSSGVVLVEASLLAVMMHQHMQHDVLCHATGEIRFVDRTMGMPEGRVGSFRIASTPAPSEKFTFRFGRP